MLASGRTSAANPTTINFQGKVVNADGTNVADGNYSFVFRLYQNVNISTYNPNTLTCVNDTNCYWEETDSSVSVKNGVFQVSLGLGCSFSSACNSGYSGINFNSQNALDLTMKFNGDANGFMTPLMSLQSVPYAFNADKLGGLASSAFAQLSAANTFTNTNLIQIGSATAFQVQNGSNKNVLTVDSSGGQLILGNSSAGGVIGKLVFDNTTNTNTAAIQSGATSTGYTWTLPLADSSGCIQSNGSGTLSISACGGSVAFNNVTAGTNTAALVIGTGGSLTTSGSGTITATSVPASGLTGTTLASGVTASSLTSLGTLTGLTLSGTYSQTDNADTDKIFQVSNNALATTGNQLAYLTFKNNNGSGSSTINGLTIAEQAANAGGTNTSDLINLTATANGTINGIVLGANFTNALVVNGTTVVNGSAQVPTSVLSGNYVASTNTSGGLTGGSSGSNGANLTLSIATNGVTNSLFRQSAGTSLVGNSTGSTANVGDITASGDNTVLLRSSGALTFGTVPNAGLTNSSITLSNGTNITGGGSVSLGSSLTIGTVNNPSFSTSVTTPILTSSSALAINSSSNGNITIQPNGTGTIINQSSTNSTTAYQLENSSGAPIFVGDTTSTDATGATVNYLTYPGFEAGTGPSNPPTGWTAVSPATLTQNNNRRHVFNGLYSAKVVTTASNGGLTTSNFNSTPAAGTYIISFYVKADPTSTAISPINFIVQSTDGATHTCSPASGPVIGNSGFQRLYCSITTTGGMTALQITQNDGVARTLYIDSVQVQANSFNGNTITSPTAYQVGALQLRGVITSPLAFENGADSTNAFQITNSGGVQLLNVDTQNNGLSFSDANLNNDINFNLQVATNLINNPSFENGNANTSPAGWAADVGNGGSLTTFQTDNSQPAHDGAEELKLVTNGTNTGQGAKFTFSSPKLTANTTYTFSVWALTTDASWSTFDLGYSLNGGADTTCLAGQTLASTVTTMQQFSCTFTTDSSANSNDYVFVRNSAATAHTFFVDSASVTAVNGGFVNLITNPYFNNGTVNGWLTKPEAGGTGNSIAISTDQAKFGNRSMKVITGTVANQGAKYLVPLVANTQYSLTFWAKEGTTASGNNLFNIGRSDASYATGTITQSTTTVTGSGTTFTGNVSVGDTLIWADGTTESVTAVGGNTSLTVTGSFTQATGQSYQITRDTADCLTGQTFDTTWRMFTCTFTTSSTINLRPFIYIKNTGTTSNTFYVDGVTLVQASTGIVFSQPADNIQVDTQLNNITLNGNNATDLQPWKQNFNSLPLGRRHAGGVTGAGFIYYIGGLNGLASPTPVNAVNYSKLSSNGTIGSWNCEGTAATGSCGLAATPTNSNNIPVALYGAATLEANGYIYVIGGCSSSDATANCTTRVNTVYYAQIKPDGSTSSWITSPSTLPTATGYLSATVASGYIWITGGYQGATTANTIFYAKLNADGSTGPWTAPATATTINTAVYGATATLANGNLYIVGGCTDTSNGTCTTPTNVVQRTTLTGNNDSAFSTGTNLPIATGLHSTTLLNGNLYVFGGRQLLGGSASPTTSVYYAKVNFDGSVSNWTASAYFLPAARQGGSAVDNNSYIDYMGGYDGTNVNNTVYTTSGARILAFGGLDLVGLSGLTNADLAGAGQLTAGNTKVIGRLRVDDQATLNNGLVVNGTTSITNPNLAYTVLNVSNPSNPSLFQVRDLTQNVNTFGGLAISGGFVSQQSYYGEEFNNFRSGNCTDSNSTALTHIQARGDYGSPATACTANTGELSISSVEATSNAANSCTYSNLNAANAGERIAAVTGTTNGWTADCLEYNGTGAAGTALTLFNTGNLPQIVMKFHASATSQTQRTFVGISTLAVAVANPVTGTKGVYFTNCTAPTTPTCGSTWAGVVSDGTTAPNSATGTNAVACPATDAQGSSPQTTNFMYGRIEFRKNTAGTGVEIQFFIDYDVTNGIQETSCGTVTATGAAMGNTAMAALLMAVSANNAASANTTNLDIDYFRVWQDDTPAFAAPTQQADAALSVKPQDAQNQLTPAPLTANTAAAGPDPNKTLVQFDAATSQDTSFNSDVYVKGTLYADKIRANQIAGLEILTDKISSLQDQLAKQKATASDATSSSPAATNETGLTAGQTISDGNFINLIALAQIESKGGLVVGKDAQFNGQTIFALLAQFNGPAQFNDVATFNSDAGGNAVIKKGDKKASVVFKKEYPQTPMVVAGWVFSDTKDSSGQVVDSANAKQQRLSDGGFNFYVANVTTKGFDIVLNKNATEDLPLQWLATSIKDAQTTQSTTVTTTSP